MPRYYRRRFRYYRTGKSKYSNETMQLGLQFNGGSGSGLLDSVATGSTFPTTDNGGTDGLVVVEKTDIYGTRKVKNFEMAFTTHHLDSPLYCALVYVPEGTNPSSFTIGPGSSSLYEPNQNVICQFVIPANSATDSASVVRYKTRLSRNLDSGDSIRLIFGACDAIEADAQDPPYIVGTVNYAIKF